MKKIILLLGFAFLSLGIYSQECVIKLMVSKTSQSFAGPSTEPIKFMITVSNDTLTSSANGILKIDSIYFSKNKKRYVDSFEFFNRLDLEYYRLPKFTRTRRTLEEYCGQILAAAPRD
ncbi:hypothetical protein [Flavobacterium panacagri]|uniref:hypothetical protein n=1 Tax=Flavobacterium panacagri TaxID=3034146 RepID=UPI0025A5C86F|nr:hypothetical protein [Flavobacterium panacagri]